MVLVGVFTGENWGHERMSVFQEKGNRASKESCNLLRRDF